LKETIRRKFLDKRKQYTKVRESSDKITEKFLSLPQLRGAKSILLYYPYKNEVDTRPIIKALLQQGKYTVLLPKVSGDRIVPIKVSSLNNLKKGYAGILEPSGEETDPKGIDIIVVPAVAFDRKGYRLGYGGGFYDRFLKNSPALKVGVAFDFQVVDSLPTEEHDIPVDLIITPTKIINTKEERKDA